MKYFEHRRHSMRRDKSDNQSFLSQAGVDLARRVGQQMHKEGKQFDLVVTSTLNRAIQTPVAMGYAVNQINADLATYGNGLEEQLHKEGLSYTSGFVRLAEAIYEGSTFVKYGKHNLAIYRSLLDQVNEGQAVLVASHGGVVEFPLLVMFPDADHSTWGEMFDYCEGYRVRFDGEQFTDLEIIRVD